MRNLFLPFLIFFGAACQAPPEDTSAAGDDALLITAVPAAGVVTLDGRFNEPAYATAPAITLKNSVTAEPVTDTAYRTTIRALYDQDFLYLAYDCRDRDIHSSFRQRDEHLWLEEAVEVFIDVDDSDPNTYVEIEVSPHNVLYDSYIVDPVNIDVPATKAYDMSGLRSAVAVDGTVDQRGDEDRGWTVELAIPLAELIEGHTPDQIRQYDWKINFYRCDLEVQGPLYGAWSPTQGSFHKPERFGRIVFAKE
jgi:hypothetical protein